MTAARTAIDAAEPDGPLPELRRLAEARREISRAEEAQVRRARIQGYSWQAIAAALGISKQAAHKRFGRR